MSRRNELPPGKGSQLASYLAAPALVALILGLWIYTRTSQPSADRADRAIHEAGAHGGAVASLAQDRVHVEVLIERGGVLRVFLLGPDASELIDIEPQPLTAYIRDAAGIESLAVEMTPAPQPGDRPGRTSQFVGQLPAGWTGQACEITVAPIRVAGGRHHARFRLGPQPHEAAMPAKIAGDEERELYLSPGGRYTATDIQANGSRTASDAFPAFRARHDFQPQAGDRLCPITRTKANPECCWTVGGQSYEFCCPPCIDEFVRLAKEQPDQVLAPEDYVKR